MRQVLTELCEMLAEQKDVLETLLEMSRVERQIIINNQTEKLEGIVRLELKELSKLNALEKKRTALHKTISAEFNLPENEITVSAIAGQADPDESEAIRKLQAELTALVDQHTLMNSENRDLINAHIEYSGIMMQLLVDSEDPLNNFYDGDGKATPDKKKTAGIFDGRA